MDKNTVLFNKTLVIGIIILFVGMSVNSSTGTIVKKKCKSQIINGNTLYVGGSDPNNYTTIQGAINDAVNGDTIFVYDDSSPYYETLIIEKSINLIGETKETTVIDGNGQEDISIILIKTDDVTVQEFTIQNTTLSGYGYSNHIGIEIWSNNNTIKNNIITNTSIGIKLDHESKYNYLNLIEGNIIIENDWAGIYIAHSNDNKILKNLISDNIFGIFITANSYRNQIEQNIITNHSRCGIIIGGGSNNTIIQNHIVGNNLTGVSITQSSFNIINYNNIYKNTKNAVVSSTFVNFIIMRLIFRQKHFSHSWDDNYWGRSYSGPKPIKCTLFLLFPTVFIGKILGNILNVWPELYIPFPQFDWHPAKEPYNIGL